LEQYFDKENPLSRLLTDRKKEMDFRSENYDEYIGEIEGKPIVVSMKIDGEMTILYSDGKETYLINKLGRVRKDLPLLTEAHSILKGKDKSIFVGELYGVDLQGEELPLGETISLIRKPASEEDEKRIRFGIFDVLLFDGKKTNENDYWERMTLIQELFEEGAYVNPVYAKKTDGSSVVKEMWEEQVIQKDHEGVVLYIDGEYIKIKPQKSVDALVIAIKPQKEKELMGSLLVALMDDEGNFRTLSFVGSGIGLTETVRAEWYNWAIQNKSEYAEDELIWLNIDNNPRVVEVSYERSNVKDTDTYQFSSGSWNKIESKLSSTVIKPLLTRIRDDKGVSKDDLRLNQIPEIGKEQEAKKSFKIRSRSKHLTTPIS